jgi:hypothetical protein
MTEKQFQEIVARQAQPPFGTSTQVKTDAGDLISELTRRTAAGDAAFEPEPLSDDTQEALRLIGADAAARWLEEMPTLRDLDANFQARRLSAKDRASELAEVGTKKAAKKR